MNRKKKIGFAVATVIAIFLILECLLRLLSLLNPGLNSALSRRRESRSIPLLVDDAYLRHRLNPEHPEHDRNGYRNRKALEKAGLVALGDSQTYGIGVTVPQAWPSVVGKILDLSVYNMGVGGYGPVQNLLSTDQALSLGPKIVAFGFYSGNDLWDSFSIVYDFENPDARAFRTDDKAILDEIDQAETRQRLGEKIDRVTQETAEKKMEMKRPKGAVWSFYEFFANHSKSFGFFRAALRPIESNEAVKKLARMANPSDIRNIPERSADVLTSEGRVIALFDSEYRLSALNLSDPRIGEGLRISLEAIDEMKAKIESKGIEFFVVMIPTKELVYKETVFQDPSRFTASYFQLVETEELLWRKVNTHFRDHDIQGIDVLPALRDGVRSGDIPYPVEDGHPNRIGASRIAKTVATAIQHSHETPN